MIFFQIFLSIFMTMDAKNKIIEVEPGVFYHWCYGHQKYEPIELFYKNNHLATGRQNNCSIWNKKLAKDRAELRKNLTPIEGTFEPMIKDGAIELLQLAGYTFDHPDGLTIHQQFMERHKESFKSLKNKKGGLNNPL